MYRIYILLFSMLFVQNAFAQSGGFNPPKVTEVGISLTLFHYSGDLAESRIVAGEGQFGFGFQVRQQLAKQLFVLGSAGFGRIAGDDKNNKELSFRKYRFFSPIREFSLQAEFHPFATPFEIGATGAKLSPFVFAGGGLVLVDPKAEFYGSGPNPFPEKELKKKMFCTPVGVGVRADVYEKIGVFGSIGWRPVYSDDLDGVSLNGNPDKQDWYTCFQLGFSYMIRGYEGDGFN
jgi:OmpA-OmpF porin, OOP family